MTEEFTKKIWQVFVLTAILIGVLYQAVGCPVYPGETVETGAPGFVPVTDYAEWSGTKWKHPILRFTLCGLPDEEGTGNQSKWYYRLDLLASQDSEEIVFTDYFNFSGPVEELIFLEDFNFDGYQDIGIWNNKEDSGDTSVFLIWDGKNNSFDQFQGGIGSYSMNGKEKAVYFRTRDTSGADINEIWQWFGREFRRTGVVVRKENKKYASVNYQVIEYQDGKPDAGKILWNTRYEDETAVGEREKILERIRMFGDKIAGKYRDNLYGLGKGLIGNSEGLRT